MLHAILMIGCVWLATFQKILCMKYSSSETWNRDDFLLQSPTVSYISTQCFPFHNNFLTTQSFILATH